MDYLKYLNYETIIKLKKIKAYLEPLPTKCDVNKCIFIHIPKAAGMSIVDAIYGESVSNHDTWKEFYHRDPKKFKAYFKFSIVRHPQTRFCSAFNYLSSFGKSEIDRYWYEKYIKSYKNINSFILDGGLVKSLKTVEHFIPQSEFIFNKKDQCMVDFIGKFENLQSDINYIFDMLNLKTNLKFINESKVKVDNVLSKDSISLLNEIYARDYRNLNYEI
jgi:hypothetical protein